jgi:hypothetical protein
VVIWSKNYARLYHQIRAATEDDTSPVFALAGVYCETVSSPPVIPRNSFH